MYETFGDYIRYSIEPITQHPKILVITSTVAGVVYSFSNSLTVLLAIHISFIIIYALLSTLDWISGIIASLFVEKQTFSSTKFFKKPFLIMFCIFTIYVIQTLVFSFTHYPHNKNIVLDGLLETVIFLFHSIKIGLMVSFIIYELTSLRENFLRLKLEEFVKVIDTILLPLKKIGFYIDKIFHKTIEEDIVTKVTEETISETEEKQEN